jgi:hypothetical protein
MFVDASALGNQSGAAGEMAAIGRPFHPALQANGRFLPKADHCAGELSEQLLIAWLRFPSRAMKPFVARLERIGSELSMGNPTRSASHPKHTPDAAGDT